MPHQQWKAVLERVRLGQEVGSARWVKHRHCSGHSVKMKASVISPPRAPTGRRPAQGPWPAEGKAGLTGTEGARPVSASSSSLSWVMPRLCKTPVGRQSSRPNRQSEGPPVQSSQGTCTPGYESQHSAVTFFPHPDSVAITMTPTQWTQVATATVPMQWIQGG